MGRVGRSRQLLVGQMQGDGPLGTVKCSNGPDGKSTVLVFKPLLGGSLPPFVCHSMGPDWPGREPGDELE